jgi:hypothetical protein
MGMDVVRFCDPVRFCARGIIVDGEPARASRLVDLVAADVDNYVISPKSFRATDTGWHGSVTV